jgi:MSHA biogenesis protein MshG
VRGDLLDGRVEAPSADAAAAQLLNGGITPVEIVEVAAAAGAVRRIRELLVARRPDVGELLLFTRQMYTLLKAGVPIVRGMRGLAESTRNPLMVEVLEEITSDLESGRELSTALARFPRIFSTLFQSMVRVGENTGQLDETFLRIGQYLELEKETRERVKSALRYPTIVIVAIALAIGIINVLVIPAFAQVFSRWSMELPWATRILISTSDFFVAYWVHLLVAAGIGVFALRRYLATDHGRYRWDKLKLRLPVVGSIIHRATLGRFARAFSISFRAGVPLIQSLTVISRALDNEYVGDRVLQMRNGIERGDTLTRTAASTGLFTPLVLQMMAVGEESGALDDLLEEVAGFYEREVDYELKNLSAAIEPILIVAVGVMVLMLALGVFLPMWDLAAGVGLR